MHQHSIRQRVVSRLHPVWAPLRSFLDHDGVELAGYIAFMAMLSLFPFMIFGAALLGVVGDAKSTQTIIEYSMAFMPPQVNAVLMPVLKEIAQHSRGSLLSVGLFGAIWAASGGIEALRLGLNRAYGLEETRPLVWRRLQGIGLVIGLGAGLSMLTLLVVLEPLLFKFAGMIITVPAVLKAIWDVFRYLLSACILFLLLAALYRFLPNHGPHAPKRYAGGWATVVLWLFGASGFSYYVEHMGNYSVTYGSLGGVIITLLFFHITAMLFLIGAEVNRFFTPKAMAGGKH